MKSISSMVLNVSTALVSVSGLSVYHYKAVGQTAPYCVYAEDMEASEVAGDNRKTSQAIQGTIDFFTRTESDPLIDSIQAALNDAGIGFYLNSVQYEDETGLIHYEWIFEVS